MTVTRVAVVGLGGIGALHAGILNALPNCTLAAAVDKESKLIRLASKAIENVKFYDDMVQMLDEQGPDCVFVCTPPDTHLPITKSLLSHPRRPSAIFVEKPLALTTRDSEEIVMLAKEKDIITGIGFQRRFLPTMRKAAELIYQNSIGKLLFARCSYFVESVRTQGEGWRFDTHSGGVSLELGVHMLDVMRMLFGEGKVVSSHTSQVVSNSCEDYATARMSFERVPHALFEVGWSMWGYNPAEFRVEVYGSRGSVVANQDRVDLIMLDVTGGIVHESWFAAQLTGSLPVLLGGPENVLIDLNFIESAQGKGRPEITFEDGLIVSKLANAIRGSTSLEGLK